MSETFRDGQLVLPRGRLYRGVQVVQHAGDVLVLRLPRLRPGQAETGQDAALQLQHLLVLVLVVVVLLAVLLVAVVGRAGEVAGHDVVQFLELVQPQLLKDGSGGREGSNAVLNLSNKIAS